MKTEYLEITASAEGRKPTVRGMAYSGGKMRLFGWSKPVVVDMAGMFALFCGMASILRSAGAAQWLAKRLSPVIGRLLGPDTPDDALEYAVMNLTANLLGLGNAATPMGIQAARRMALGREAASNALCMFLVINSSSVQLLPATVIALRAAAGSADPGGIALPALIATALSTLVGIVSCKIAERLS